MAQDDLDLNSYADESQYVNESSETVLQGSGESVIDKSTRDKFFDTEGILQRIEKTLRGFEIIDNQWVRTCEPLARDEFISRTTNLMRAGINQVNSISVLGEDEIRELLWQVNENFIYLCIEESTLDEDDFEYITDVFDISLQLFMGHVYAGHGANTLKQLSASVFHAESKQENKNPSFMDLFRR